MLHERRLIMKFEVLRKNHLKRNIIIGVIAVLIISAIVLNFTRARYRVTQSIPLVNGTINYSLPDINIVALYINGEEAEELDGNTNYILDTTNSTCTYRDGSTIDNLTLSYDSSSKTFTIAPYTTKGTKCTLYFNIQLPLLRDEILNGRTVQVREFPISRTTTVTGTNRYGDIYEEEDDWGKTYYFAGNPTDNWVRFAGFYWRIIRINGDGSIRLIYQGTSANTTGTGTRIGTSAFNEFRNASYYVGYMYSEDEQHGLDESSAVKTTLDNWYLTNIENNNLSQYISTEAGFCGDCELASGYTWSISGDLVFYAAYSRVGIDDSIYPSFKCSNSSDLYTVNESSKGNHALTYPIALITADEVIFGGLSSDSSSARDNYILAPPHI